MFLPALLAEELNNLPAKSRDKCKFMSQTGLLAGLFPPKEKCEKILQALRVGAASVAQCHL